MSTQTFISTTQLQDWLPHRSPMVWIDEVGATSDDGGTCYVTLKPEGLYFTDRVLRPTSVIEFLAQGFGYVVAAHKVRAGLSLESATKRAFLVAVTQCQLGDMTFALPGSRLTVVLFDVKQVGPIQLFKGIVTAASGETLGTASLKVFSE